MVSDDINSPQVFNWKIAFALVIAWILVYMCMIKGIASSGKVSGQESEQGLLLEYILD